MEYEILHVVDELDRLEPIHTDFEAGLRETVARLRDNTGWREDKKEESEQRYRSLESAR